MSRPKPIEIVGELPEGATVTVDADADVRSVVGYVRVSSKQEDRQRLSPETQREVIRAYAKLHSLGAVAIMEERGSAATIRKRPVLLHILDLCRSGQVKHVIVQDTTRLFRDVREALNVFFELEKQHGVRFHSAVDGDMDTTTADGVFMRDLKLVLGQRERRLIGERTRRVMQATKRVREADKDLNPAMRHHYDHGLILAGKPPFGYRFRTLRNQSASRTILEPCPVNMPIVERIHELAAEGLSGGQIAQRLLAEDIRCKDGKRRGSVVRRETVWRVLKRGWK